MAFLTADLIDSGALKLVVEDQQASFKTANLLNDRALRLIFNDPKLRPPVLTEMQPDIDRLAASIARMRFDASCPALNMEDLVAECNFKLAVLITKGKLQQPPTRYEAFKYIKAVFNNHIKSLVAKHRLTLKRGYRYGEDVKDRELSLNASPKNTDLSADDPDQHIQIADPKSCWAEDSEYIDDIAIYLTPIELLIAKEYSKPSERTRFFAEYDSMLGKKHGELSSLNFSDKNYADGLGIDLATFKKGLKSLREKLTKIKMGEPIDQEVLWNRAISRLEAVFGIQIPHSIERQVVRRLLTMAAVDQYEKVEFVEQVKADLQFVGAKVPERRAGTLACLGILFQKNSRTCATCGYARACQDEAINYGLGDITIDPRLFGSKQSRIPAVVSNEPQLAPIMDKRAEEIYNYLKENFNCTRGVNDWVFRHKDVGGVAAIVKWTPDIEIRLVRPSASMKAMLEHRGADWYLPVSLDAKAAIELIQRHAHECFVEQA